MTYLIRLALLSFLPFFITFAEEAQRGRLDDGRAFRTDAQGYQLVDYIAELELKIEELQNQIVSMQNESSYQATSSNFEEADLLPAQQEPVKQVQEVDCEQATSACYDMLKQQKQTSEQYQKQSEQYQRQVALLQSEVDQDLANTKGNQAALRTEIINLKQTVNDLNSSLLSTEQELATSQQELSSKAQLIKIQESKITTLKSELSAKPKYEPVQVKAQLASSSYTSKKRQSAFDHLKSKLQQDLNAIDRFKNERARLEKQYKTSSKRKTIKISLSPLKTKDGYTASSLRSKLSQASRFSELGKLQKNIFKLKKSLEADVALLKRMLK